MCPPPPQEANMTNDERIKRFIQSNSSKTAKFHLDIIASSKDNCDYFDVLVNGDIVSQGKDNVERFQYTDSDGYDWYDCGYKASHTVTIPFDTKERSFFSGPKLISKKDVEVTVIFYKDGYKKGARSIDVFSDGKDFSKYIIQKDFKNTLYVVMERSKSGVFVKDPGKDRRNSTPEYYIVEKL